jgi:hypothetical protein
VGFVVDKVASGQVFSEYFGFPCLNHTNFSIITIIITNILEKNSGAFQWGRASCHPI